MQKITKEYIKETFDEYNKKYFDNKLKYCKFSVFSTTQGVGFAFCDCKNVKGKIHGKIGISKNVNWTEETFKEILIHEMIHLYNSQIENETFKLGPCHTWKFRRKLNEINRNYNMNMTICHPDLYIVNEKAPSTFFGKLMRRIRFEFHI